MIGPGSARAAPTSSDPLCCLPSISTDQGLLPARFRRRVGEKGGTFGFEKLLETLFTLPTKR